MKTLLFLLLMCNVASSDPTLKYRYDLRPTHVYSGGTNGEPSCGNSSRFLHDRWDTRIDAEDKSVYVNGTMLIWLHGDVPGDFTIQTSRGIVTYTLDIVSDDSTAMGTLLLNGTNEAHHICMDRVEMSGPRR